MLPYWVTLFAEVAGTMEPPTRTTTSAAADNPAAAEAVYEKSHLAPLRHPFVVA